MSGNRRAVLLHGQPGAGAAWHRVVRALDDSIETIAPDRPGYGQNPRAAGGIHDNVEWLIELLRTGDAPTVVVAHSWAGGVALELARRRPDLLSGLVLLASVGPGAISVFDRVLTLPIVGPALMRPMFVAGEPVVRRLVTRDVRDPETREELLASMDASRGREVWRTFLVEQASLVADMSAVVDDLGSIATPTVVVAGTKDRVVPFATARRLSEALPDARLVAVDGAGHMLQRSHPEVVAEAVRQAFAAAR
ncbi:MAG: hypothetical protein QOG90_587 [Actinomycetota bacterium]